MGAFNPNDFWLRRMAGTRNTLARAGEVEDQVIPVGENLFPAGWRQLQRAATQIWRLKQSLAYLQNQNHHYKTKASLQKTKTTTTKPKSPLKTQSVHCKTKILQNLQTTTIKSKSKSPLQNQNHYKAKTTTTKPKSPLQSQNHYKTKNSAKSYTYKAKITTRPKSLQNQNHCKAD